MTDKDLLLATAEFIVISDEEKRKQKVWITKINPEKRLATNADFLRYVEYQQKVSGCCFTEDKTSLLIFSLSDVDRSKYETLLREISNFYTFMSKVERNRVDDEKAPKR
uniref:Uncharacterized protein n=1 Tax=Vespula pensylvanica TaxID=30213 RepID=A0A834PBI5_VESPE|nr:hypothetical protein H0235_003191 [Vespula pensylvanica]